MHGVAQLTSGVRHALIIFIGLPPPAAPPPDCVLDATARSIEAHALQEIMRDAALLARVATKLGGVHDDDAAVSRLHAQYARVQSADLGALIARVVEHYAAPQLRPTSVLERLRQGHDAASFSLRALLSYAEQMSSAEDT